MEWASEPSQGHWDASRDVGREAPSRSGRAARGAAGFPVKASGRVLPRSGAAGDRRGRSIRPRHRRRGSRRRSSWYSARQVLSPKVTEARFFGVDYRHFLAALADIGDALRRRIVGRRARDRRPVDRLALHAGAEHDTGRSRQSTSGASCGSSPENSVTLRGHKCHTSSCSTARNSTTRSTAAGRPCCWCRAWAATAAGGARMCESRRANSPWSCTITAAQAAAHCRASPTVWRRWPTMRCS